MYYLCTGNERLRPRNALLMSDNAFSLKIMYEFIYLMCKATCEIYRQFSKLARTQGKSSKIIRKLCFFVKRRKGYQTMQLGGGGSGWETIPLWWIIHQVASYIYIYLYRKSVFFSYRDDVYSLLREYCFSSFWMSGSCSMMRDGASALYIGSIHILCICWSVSLLYM